MNPPKETGLPKDFFTREGQIIHTQPRINATEGQAKFVAATLMGVDVGAGLDIGIINSKNKNSDRRNLWIPITDGSFKNLIIKGKLGSFGYVIIDEAHERSLNIDEILRLLKDRMSLYPKIKIIIASATIDAEKFRDFFGQDITTIIEFEGKLRKDKNGNLVSYQEFYQDQSSALPYEDFSKLSRVIVANAYEKALSLATEIITGKKNRGDILVFLQGMEPIKTAVDKSRDYISHDDNLANNVEVYPLYRDLPENEKDKINKHNLEDGKIWIIFSTNIAEASVTIDSLGYEVETGVENQSTFDPSTNTTSLPLTLISKANARQRWGRTGRTRNGEVYCLYTKDQFDNLFLDYPVSAIERSSMEETLLVMKAAGIPNPTIGWLQNPKIEEMERSNTALVESGILTEDGVLSKRGLLLSNFSYPAKLVDALFMADSWGIIVEIATLLPIIKNGGNKKILEWKYSWDAYTKMDAFQKHKALFSGCYDDIEFFLKIISLWTEMSWLKPNSLKGKQPEELDLIRHDWAKQNFVNIDVIEKIINEREELFNHFFEDTKYEEIRKIDFTLLPRIRQLLLTLFPEIKINESKIPYAYDDSFKPEEGSNVNCNCLMGESNFDKIDDWMNPKTFKDGDQTEILSRLFIDQIYPIKSRFFAVPIEETSSLLKRTSEVIPSILYIKETIAEEEVDEDDLEQKNDDNNLNDKKTEISLEKFSFNYDFVVNQIYCQQAISKETETLLEFEVVDYQFEGIPAVIVRPVTKPEPFDEFNRLFKSEAEVNVQVVKIFSYPKDNHPTLLVCETRSKMEILMEAAEISFSNSSAVIENIPIDSVLRARVDNIISEARRVHLSILNQTESRLNKLFASESKTSFNKKDNFVITNTRVVEIRPDNVSFLLDWAEPEQAFMPIASCISKILPKKPEEYQLGEEVSISIFRGNKKPYKMTISKLPKKMKLKKENNQLPEGFTYQEKSVEFVGRMTDVIRSNLRSYDKNEEYQNAIDRLYWLSNRILVKEFLDNEWGQEVKRKYPLNTNVKATVKDVIKESGLTVLIDDSYKAFLPRSRVLGRFSENLTQNFHPGDIIYTKVIDVNYMSKQLILEQTLEEEQKPVIPTPVLPPVVEVPSPKTPKSPSRVSTTKTTPANPATAKTPTTKTSPAKPSIPKPPAPKAIPPKPPTPPEPEGFWKKFKKWLSS